MTTLHGVINNIKTAAKWGGIFLGGIFTLIILIKATIGIKEFFFPTPPAPPNIAYGKLPVINFPPSISHDTYFYTLDTLSGTLPNFPDRLKVYRIIHNAPNLLNLDRAKNKISQVGFTTPDGKIVAEKALSDTLYEWDESTGLFRKMLMDINSYNFNMTSSFAASPAVLSALNLPDETGAIQQATSFLSGMSLLPNDLDNNKTTTQLLTIQNGVLASATSLSQAQVIRVDFFQKDVDKLPIFYPHPPYSTMNFFVTGGDNQPQIAEAHFFYNLIEPSSKATYPIKSSKEAFKELENGNAYIAANYNAGNQIFIKNIFLAYFLSDKDPQFLMPIVVFQGKNGFFAYVSAIKDTFLTP